MPIPYSMSDAVDYVGTILPRGWAEGSEWGFVVEHEGEYAGAVSLRPEEPGPAEVAYGSHPRARGTGAIERALRLLLAWGFEERDLHTVVWRAHRGNWASRKLAWRLGFTFEGTLRSYLPQRGELRDAWVGTLLVDDPREPATPWLVAPMIEADGLRLRPFTDLDVPRIVEGSADPRTSAWLGQLPASYTAADAADYLEAIALRHATNAGITWAVADLDTDVLLGSVGVFDHTPVIECEVGYWTHPDARGRGVATRAVALALEHCFAELGVNRVKALSAVDNVASRHVLEANGLTHTGIERLGAHVRDGYADAALYDVLASEFPARR